MTVMIKEKCNNIHCTSLHCRVHNSVVLEEKLTVLPGRAARRKNSLLITGVQRRYLRRIKSGNYNPW